jgi:DNA-binding MarR family transcriptional regulator
MSTTAPPPAPIDRLRAWFAKGVASNEPDLTARQIAVLLTVHRAEPQTVRGLAAALNVNKPAITRATSRLIELSYVSKEREPHDRRSVLIKPTKQGATAVRKMAQRLEGF